jgi:hypothetical protein
MIRQERGTRSPTVLSRRIATVAAALLPFGVTAACTSTVEGRPTIGNHGNSSAPNEQAAQFNEILKRVALFNMCLITNDSRTTSAPNGALHTPDVYDKDAGGWQLFSVVPRIGPPRPTTELVMNATVIRHIPQASPPPPYKAERVTLRVRHQMNRFNNRTALELGMLEPDRIDYRGEAKITIVAPDAYGKTLMKNGSGEVTVRDYPQGAENEQNPIDSAGLDSFEVHVDEIMAHMDAIAQFDCLPH